MRFLPGLPDLNKEDLLLLILIVFLLSERGRENWEITAGLVFLLIAGLNDRARREETGADAPPGDLIPFGA